MIMVDHEPSEHARIKVIGVGGGGCNAIKRMKEASQQPPNVEFIAVNTDAQVLNISPADVKIQIGKEQTKGLGAGAKPEVGKIAAEESESELREHLQDTDLVFLTAGMGGGTGTGATPVLAKIAKDMGCLTVSIVTTPFKWEGPVRKRNADAGIEQLKQYSDTSIIISNQKLLSILPKKVKMSESFKEADKILKDATMGLSNLIQKPGMISLDFADVVTIMKDAGKAHIGIGFGEGEDKAEKAVEQAIHSELLDNISIKGAKGALVHIIAGNDFELDEMDQIMEKISQEIGVDESDTNVINGLTLDEEYDGKLQILLIVTNLQGESKLVEENIAFNKKENIKEEVLESSFNSSNSDLGNNFNPIFETPKEEKKEEIKEELVFPSSRETKIDEDDDTPPFLRDQNSRNSLFNSGVFDNNIFKSYLD